MSDYRVQTLIAAGVLAATSITSAVISMNLRSTGRVWYTRFIGTELVNGLGLLAGGYLVAAIFLGHFGVRLFTPKPESMLESSPPTAPCTPEKRATVFSQNAYGLLLALPALSVIGSTLLVIHLFAPSARSDAITEAAQVWAETLAASQNLRNGANSTAVLMVDLGCCGASPQNNTVSIRTFGAGISTINVSCGGCVDAIAAVLVKRVDVAVRCVVGAAVVNLAVWILWIFGWAHSRKKVNSEASQHESLRRGKSGKVKSGYQGQQTVPSVKKVG
ncbi:hypothetical protein DFJ73DRAFT_762863 [Zopfochytrium polystomum]|nr:hypothetical protein DFJ73DRAFT_762863 [Zopfochytrium polystomum]